MWWIVVNFMIGGPFADQSSSHCSIHIVHGVDTATSPTSSGISAGLETSRAHCAHHWTTRIAAVVGDQKGADSGIPPQWAYWQAEDTCGSLHSITSLGVSWHTRDHSKAAPRRPSGRPIPAAISPLRYPDPPQWVGLRVSL